MTDVLQWWLFFVKRFVTRSSVSAMRSSITTMLRLLASKEVGSSSSSKLFRNISRAGQNRVAGRTWPAGRVLHMVDLVARLILAALYHEGRWLSW